MVETLVDLFLHNGQGQHCLVAAVRGSDGKKQGSRYQHLYPNYRFSRDITYSKAGFEISVIRKT